MTVDASWRGIATEQVDEVSAPLAALLRKRSRRCSPTCSARTGGA